MSLKLTAAHQTTMGLRVRNDDCVGMMMPVEPALSAKGMIGIVADGVSGSAGGGEAAKLAVRSLLKDYYAAPDSNVTEALDTVLCAINHQIYERGAAFAERGGMATTLTALVLRDHAYYFSHVGDTRLYRLRNDTFEQLTTDHVADSSAKKHLLTRAMGLDARVMIDHGTGELETGDIFLLATDGVWAVVPEHELSWHVSELVDDKRSAEGTAQLLIDAALAAGSTDNVSVLVVRIDQLPTIL
ncbi:MAG: PP2C family protein-serine/threonine phosphatase [Oxalobacteraceae bacterium]